MNYEEAASPVLLDLIRANISARRTLLDKLTGKENKGAISHNFNALTFNFLQEQDLAQKASPTHLMAKPGQDQSLSSWIRAGLRSIPITTNVILGVLVDPGRETQPTIAEVSAAVCPRLAIDEANQRNQMGNLGMIFGFLSKDSRDLVAEIFKSDGQMVSDTSIDIYSALGMQQSFEGDVIRQQQKLSSSKEIPGEYFDLLTASRWALGARPLTPDQT